jgi:galactokinase
MLPPTQKTANEDHQADADLGKKFRDCYGAQARFYRAPGRVNLIGEHTDYNDGFVMPAAIEFYVWIAIAGRNDRKLSVRSDNFSETVEFDLQQVDVRPRGHWSDYVRGVALMLGKTNQIRGANLLVRGDVPIGAGLSSSAAIEVATGLALLENSDLLMDQFISCCGHAGRALMLDCRSLEYKLLSLPSDVSLVICNTMVKHALAGGEYNIRRAECEEGVRLLSTKLPHIKALRDVTESQLEQHANCLPEVIHKRCRHVISENERVLQAAEALSGGDLDGFGSLMAQSHRSLQRDYEVSCAELDLMAELAQKQAGVYGARMTGGGFGGCTINLVRSDYVADFKSNIAKLYEKSTGISPQIFVSSAAQGAGEVRERELR